MPTTPITAEMDYVSFSISIDGSPLLDTYDVLSIEVERAVNRIAKASFSLLLPVGQGNNQDFAASEASTLMPGGAVEIKLGYNSKEKTVFKGLILRHGIRTAAGQRPVLDITCQDEAIKLSLGNRIRTFAEKTDSDIITSVVGEAGLAKDIATTSYQHPVFIQPQANDWDFIVSRAEANGMIVYTNDGKLMVQKPTASDSLDFEVDYERHVMAFDAELDASFQLPSVKASGWNFASRQFAAGNSQEPSINAQGNVTGSSMADVVGASEVNLQVTGPVAAEELTSLAQATLLRSRLSLLRGQVTFFGNATPQLNKLITLQNFGARFNGDALVTRVKHSVREGNWRTEVGFGLSSEGYQEKRGRGNSSTPVISGLQNGVVKKIDEDPDGESRIQVEVPVLATTLWARMGTFYATAGQGTFFLPEVDDEVIVGFLNDDPRYAVVLGSIYSSKNAPAYTADAENSTKAFTTKSQLKMEFNDKDKVLTLLTPGGNQCVFSDKDKSVVLTDQNGNKVTMDSSGITLKSAKDITLEATGNVVMKANQGITATASGGDVALKGLNVNVNGNIGVTVKGGATAELSAAGNTTVKGAMVMIN